MNEVSGATFRDTTTAAATPLPGDFFLRTILNLTPGRLGLDAGILALLGGSYVIVAWALLRLRLHVTGAGRPLILRAAAAAPPPAVGFGEPDGTQRV